MVCVCLQRSLRCFSGVIYLVGFKGVFFFGGGGGGGARGVNVFFFLNVYLKLANWTQFR